jgi:methylmalonyl-CoA mutase N-terminal domain/subunit
VWLTDEMERRIEARLREIEARGEPAALAESGFFRRIFQDAMERHARTLASGERCQVGVNRFRVPESEDALLREVAETKIEPCHERIDEIRRHRAARDAGRLRASLAALHDRAADRRTNLTPAVIDAFEAGATVGEMTGVLRMAHGQPADPFGRVPDPL